MKKFFNHAKVYIFRGFLAIIPIFLCYSAIKLLLVLIDRNVLEFLNRFFEVRKIPGFGLLLAALVLYLIGLIASNFVGRQLFSLIERITERIPFIKTIYSVGKQLSQSLSLTGEDKKAFKKAVLVNAYMDLWVPAFVTGSVKDQKTQQELLIVFVPTVPNPTTGFVFIAQSSQVKDPGWTVEESLKAIVSAGIIIPKEIKK